MKKASFLLPSILAIGMISALGVPAAAGQEPGVLTLSPSTINFGYVVVNGASASPTLDTLTNGTSSAVTINGITVPTGFTHSAGQAPVCTKNLVVQPGHSCTFSVSFAPTGSVGSGTGSYSGTVKVLTSGGNPAAAVSGFATDPAATVSNVVTRHAPCGPPPSLSTSRICYALTVSNSTDNLGNLTVNVIVDFPPSGTTVLGTILYTGGGGGASYYQAFTGNGYAGGQNTITGLLNAGYVSAQTQFLCPTTSCACTNGTCTGDAAAGWLTYTSGTGSAIPDGPRILVSRYVAVAQWVHDNVLTLNTAYCATGNSAGGAAIAYGLSHFGLDKLFNFIEVTCGPPLARLDYACGEGTATQNSCGVNNISENVGSCAQQCILDPAFNASKYSTKACSQQGASSSTLLTDSIDTPGSDSLSTYAISIRMLLGQLDAIGGDGAVAQGMEWYTNFANVSSSNPVVGKTSMCVANAGHGLPGYQSGSMQIISDMINIPSASNPYGCALPSANARRQTPLRLMQAAADQPSASECMPVAAERLSSRR